MKIGILETGDVLEELRERHGDYPGMLAELLAGQGFEFRTWRALDGRFPADPREADGWLITGSRHGVYEGHSWIAPLEAFARAVMDARLPLVGVCFDHQIMAQATGGRVEKSDEGWQLGPQTYQSAETGGPLTLLGYHQDQVVAPPPGVVVLSNCPAPS